MESASGSAPPQMLQSSLFLPAASGAADTFKVAAENPPWALHVGNQGAQACLLRRLAGISEAQIAKAWVKCPLLPLQQSLKSTWEQRPDRTGPQILAQCLLPLPLGNMVLAGFIAGRLCATVGSCPLPLLLKHGKQVACLGNAQPSKILFTVPAPPFLQATFR